MRLLFLLLIYFCTISWGQAQFEFGTGDRGFYGQNLKASFINNRQNDNIEGDDFLDGEESSDECQRERNDYHKDWLHNARLHKISREQIRDSLKTFAYDGGEFNAPSFMDTDFEQHVFKDQIDTKSHLSPLPNRYENLAAKKMFPTKLADESSSNHDQTWKKLEEPDGKMPYDWVPRKIQRIHNSGFGKAEDNGRVVPYRLNGHINIERGYPWEKENK